MEAAYYNLLYDVLKGYDHCTPSKIVSLRNNQIFVFGTNKYGSQKYNPQIEMFARFKMKSSFHKTKRII